MTYFIELANRVVEIDSPYAHIPFWGKDYLLDPNLQITADIRISVTLEDILREAEKHKLIDQQNMLIAYHSLQGIEYESIIIHNKIAEAIISYDTILFHGSVVKTAEHAYVFSAPSGTGKSRRTKIWMEEFAGSIVINGDKPFLSIKKDVIYAYGTPWCGKEGWNTNTKAPLRAFFLLERTEEGEKSSIKELSFSEAFVSLLQQTYWPEKPEAKRKTLQLLKAMEGKVKFYRLRSDLSPEAIHLAYETACPK